MMRLSLQLLLSSALIVLAVVLITGITITSGILTDSMKEHISKDLATIGDTIGTTIDEFVLQKKTAMVILATNLPMEGIEQDHKLQDEYLKMYQKNDPSFDDLTLVRADGIVITSTFYDYRGEWKDNSWFKRVISTGDAVVSDAYPIYDPEKIVMDFFAPINISGKRGEDAVVDYVIAGQVDLGNTLSTLVLNIGEDNPNSISVLRNDGTMIINQNPALLLSKSLSIEESTAITKQINVSGSAILTMNNPSDNETYLYSFSPAVSGLIYNGDGCWFVRVGQPKANLLAYVNLINNFVYPSICTIIILSCALLFLLVHFNIILPLKRIEKATVSIKSGIYPQIKVKGNNEMSDTTKSFNSMATTIKTNSEKITRNNELLQKSKNHLAKTVEQLMTTKDIIEKQNRKLQSVDRLKSDFLNMTSHELRTPITAMKGHIQMIENGTLGPTTEEQEKSLKVVLRNSDRLDTIVQDILDTSRLESGTMNFTPKDTDIHILIKEVIETMRTQAHTKDIEIIADISREIPSANIDNNRIKQVIVNLLTNAIKFSNKKTTIHVTAHKTDEEDILFEIKDEGRGIPKEKQSKIFDLFYQVENGPDRAIGGNGLGLAITRGIVIAHGGKIWVESSSSKKGSTFFFTVPINPPEDLEKQFKKVDIFNVESKNPPGYETTIKDIDRAINEPM